MFFLEGRSRLPLLDSVSLETIEERDIERVINVPDDFRIAKFHRCGDAMLFETERALIAISSDGIVRTIAQHNYPANVVRKVEPDVITIQDGLEEMSIPW